MIIDDEPTSADMRPELEELSRLTRLHDDYYNYDRWTAGDSSGKALDLDAITARTDIPALLAALAAERDRADRAEARLAEAWDEGRQVTNNSGTWIENERRGTRTFVPTPNPYRSEADA